MDAAIANAKRPDKINDGKLPSAAAPGTICSCGKAKTISVELNLFSRGLAQTYLNSNMSHSWHHQEQQKTVVYSLKN